MKKFLKIGKLNTHSGHCTSLATSYRPGCPRLHDTIFRIQGQLRADTDLEVRSAVPSASGSEFDQSQIRFQAEKG